MFLKIKIFFKLHRFKWQQQGPTLLSSNEYTRMQLSKPKITNARLARANIILAKFRTQSSKIIIIIILLFSKIRYAHNYQFEPQIRLFITLRYEQQTINYAYQGRKLQLKSRQDVIFIKGYCSQSLELFCGNFVRVNGFLFLNIFTDGK